MDYTILDLGFQSGAFDHLSIEALECDRKTVCCGKFLKENTFKVPSCHFIFGIKIGMMF